VKLGFIGSGRMAEAIIRGLICKKAISKNNIIISDKDPGRVKVISKKYGIKASAGNIEAARSADVIVLSVKPQVMNVVLSELSGKVRSNQLVISIAAGITIRSIEKYLKKTAVIRVMPNNPALIGEGISAVSGGSNAEEKDMRTAEKIFSNVGDTIRVDEKLMNAVTALSGSGPAFVYETLNALIEGGIEAGLSKELSASLARATVLGSIRTVIKTGKSPEELKAMVTSPGGTTLAGLRVLDEAGFKSLVKKAVVRASARAREISEEFERSL